MNVARLFRHLRSTSRDARHLFGRDTLARLQKVVADGERRHRGEVRLVIESALPLRDVIRDVGTRHRAFEVFATYRVWDTEENNGVLMYVNIADRRFEIVADRAATRAIDDSVWRSIVADARPAFASGDFERGLAQALDAMNVALTDAFPSDGTAGRNELSDAPVVR